MPAANYGHRHDSLMVGFHVSISSSIALSVDRAQVLGCTAFQIFTRSPRTWTSGAISSEAALAFREKRRSAGFARVAVHMPYLPNLASSDGTTMRLSRAALGEELQRCRLLRVDYLVVHLGSHRGEGAAAGMRNVADACNRVLAEPSGPRGDGEPAILLENMAGQSGSIGSRFEELGMILHRIKNEKRVGICLDTCHAFAAGYDLSSRSGIDRTIDAFDDAVGLERLKLIHLNDSKGALGSALDRHERVGLGHIGITGFRALLRHKRYDPAKVPLIMEPSEDPLVGDDIQLVRRLAGARRR